MRGCKLLLAALAAPVGTLAGQTPPDSAGLDRALQHYADLISRMAHDSIAALYLPDGELAAPDRDPIVGPAAIAAFLKSFSAYQVYSHRMTADTVRFRGDTALQIGTFRQRVRLPDGTTVEAAGIFRAEWLQVGGTWRVRRMATAPPPHQAAGPPDH
jgi:ketosteroid isomerase-like protein